MPLKGRLPLKIKTIALTDNFDELARVKKYTEGLVLKFSFDFRLYSSLTK